MNGQYLCDLAVALRGPAPCAGHLRVTDRGLDAGREEDKRRRSRIDRRCVSPLGILIGLIRLVAARDHEGVDPPRQLVAERVDVFGHVVIGAARGAQRLLGKSALSSRKVRISVPSARAVCSISRGCCGPAASLCFENSTLV